MGRNLLKLVAITCALGGGGYALAASTGEVITARQQQYKQIGKANKAIQDELKASQPSLPVIAANAKTLEGLARQIPRWFPRGSGPEAGVKTGALPAIWQQVPKFKQSAAQLAGAAHAVRLAATSGNLDRTRAAAAGVGQTCKGCHDSFRAKQ